MIWDVGIKIEMKWYKKYEDVKTDWKEYKGTIRKSGKGRLRKETNWRKEIRNSERKKKCSRVI